jgi:hypothetical protein
VASQIPRSQFLRFLSLGKPKGKVYRNNPRTTEALLNEITRVIGSITVDQLQKVSHNLPRIHAMQGMFASRRGFLSAPVIKQGKFVLSFYSILINVCTYRKWCEGISDTTARETSRPLYASESARVYQRQWLILLSTVTAAIREECCSGYTFPARFPPGLNFLQKS